MAMLRRKKAQSPEIIDLRDPAPSKPEWGSPVPCPSCGGRGYVDHIDLDSEMMSLHCTECMERYDLAKADFGPSASTDTFTV